MRSNRNVDVKIHHGITCTLRFFPESVSYRAMGRSILSLHYLLLNTTLGLLTFRYWPISENAIVIFITLFLLGMMFTEEKKKNKHMRAKSSNN